MIVVWSRRATGHLIALHDYIAEDSPRSAGGVARHILEAVELLATQPHIGRPGRITGTRELVVAGTSYIIPYRVRAGRMELLAVFHGRQKWPDKLN
jgi:toxin ParE1/3/4